MIEKNILALRGGASRGLVYFRLMKELYYKGIIFKNISGSSAGGIFAALIACVRIPEKAYELFKAIRGDKIMRWACEAQTGKRMKSGKKVNIFGRIFRGIGVGVLNFIPITSMKKAFKKHLSWEKAMKNGTKRLIIGVTKQKDVLRVLGKEAFNELKRTGLRDFLDGDGFDDIKEDSLKIISRLPMFFFSHDGIYQRGYFFEKPYKISNHVEPLWKVLLGTFANPILPNVRLKFGKFFREKCFDGGIANNFANIIWTTNDLTQVSCLDIPDKITGKEKGLAGINTLYYNLNKPKNEVIISTDVKYKGFFGFYDANIEAYYNEAATDIF